MTPPRDVLITGATGYLGRALIPQLIARGHRVRAFVRAKSLPRVPAGAEAVTGDALSTESLAAALRPGDTLVHLVGTPHPGPGKSAEFLSVDLVSAMAAVEAAKLCGVAHFVYLSVAQPAPMLGSYLDVRARGEKAIIDAGLTATMVRPWYVLGPGHWWPVVLIPVYAVARLIPPLRAGAERLGLVTLAEMTAGLVRAVEEPPAKGDVQVMDVPAIRASIILPDIS